jgi:hypothetical protein
MMIQYDLVHPEDRNQDEFRAVISAIEGRIVKERRQIESMTRDMNHLLETTAGDGTESTSGAEARHEPPVPAGTEPYPPPAETRGAETLPSAPQSEVRIPSIPSFSQPGSAEESLHMPFLKNSQAQETSAGQTPAGSDVTDTGGLSAEPGGELPVDTMTSFEQTGTAVAGEESAPAQVIVSGISSAGTIPEGSAYTPGSRPELDRSPDSPDTIPRDEDRPEYRPVVPADPDALPSSPGESPTGAGTDIPMAWDRSREWKKPAGQPPARNGPSGPVSAATGGLLARIIALVTGVFRKK